jgi:predicted Fe-S protein YdhL (DUF1289 family)
MDFGFAICCPLREMTAESPCIGVCQLAEHEAVCAGCHRTLSEIAAWLRLTETEKFRVLAAIRERRKVQEAKTKTLQTP